MKYLLIYMCAEQTSESFNTRTFILLPQWAVTINNTRNCTLLTARYTLSIKEKKRRKNVHMRFDIAY